MLLWNYYDVIQTSFGRRSGKHIIEEYVANLGGWTKSGSGSIIPDQSSSCSNQNVDNTTLKIIYLQSYLKLVWLEEIPYQQINMCCKESYINNTSTCGILEVSERPSPQFFCMETYYCFCRARHNHPILRPWIISILLSIWKLVNTLCGIVADLLQIEETFLHFYKSLLNPILTHFNLTHFSLESHGLAILTFYPRMYKYTCTQILF